MKKIFVLGSLNMDIVIKTPYMPSKGETILGSGLFYNPGGKGANQAVASSKQGVETYLIGSVGMDANGEELIKKAKSYGVNHYFIKKDLNNLTGVAIIVLTEGDNRIILDGGANQHISHDLIDEALKIAKPDDIFITQLENNIDAVYYGIEKAKEKGLITIFNPAPAKKLDDKIYSLVDYLIINEIECDILSNIKPNSDEDFHLAYKYFNEKGLKNLIITLGEKGSILLGKETVKMDSIKVKVVDTTAAGDTYVGALASCLAKDMNIKESLEYASCASGLTCTKEGAQQSIPLYNDVIKMLNK